ncbi:hypothetical protein DFJ73DRAFT_962361 [Zopfochytrium polystomum]|nr:hypothetical protein DFJ73DRAFT_962361 [Zopfochytrium polystomum]
MPLRRRPRRAVVTVAAVVAAVAATVGCVVLDSIAFPAVARVGRNGGVTAAGAEAIALDFAKRAALPPLSPLLLGAPDGGVAVASRYESSTQLGSYLELSGGGRAAFAAYARADDALVPFHAWHVRVFKELEFEETSFLVAAADGRVVSFRASLNESTALPTLSRDEAVAAAADFLRESFPWLAPLNLSVSSHAVASVSKSLRQDHSIQFEDKDVRLGEATFFAAVEVKGDKVTKVSTDYLVPPDHKLRMTRLRASNENITKIATMAVAVFAALAFTAGLWHLYRNKELRFRFPLRVAALYTALTFLGNLSDLNQIWFQYNTSVSRLSFLVTALSIVLSSTAVNPLMTSFCLSIADGLTARAFPRLPALSFAVGSLFSGRPHPIVAEQVFVASVLVPIKMLFVELFYWIATQYFGFWLPTQNLTNPNAVASYFPGIGPTAMAFSAGLFEEAIFRAVIISGFTLLGKRVGMRQTFIVLGIVVQALVFGGCHAFYAMQPSYARIVELFLPSVMYGMLYIEYGLLPCFLVHFHYDLVLMARTVLSANPAIFFGSQALVALFLVGPLALCIPTFVSEFSATAVVAPPPPPVVCYSDLSASNADVLASAADAAAAAKKSASAAAGDADLWYKAMLRAPASLRRPALLLAAGSLAVVLFARNPRKIDVYQVVQTTPQDALQSTLALQATMNLTHMAPATRHALARSSSTAREWAGAASALLAATGVTPPPPGSPWYTVALVNVREDVDPFFLLRHVRGPNKDTNIDLLLLDEPFFAKSGWIVHTRCLFGDAADAADAKSSSSSSPALFSGAGEDAHSALNSRLRARQESFEAVWDFRGRLASFRHAVALGAPGAHVDQSNAVDLAVEFLGCGPGGENGGGGGSAQACSGLGLERDRIRLEKTAASNLPARRDWEVHFADLRYEGLPLDAKVVHQVRVSDNRVAAFSTVLQHSQQYRQSQQASQNHLAPFRIAAGTAATFLVLGLMIAYFRQVARQGIQRRWIAAFFAVIVLANVTEAVLNLPNSLTALDPAVPIGPQVLFKAFTNALGGGLGSLSMSFLVTQLAPPFTYRRWDARVARRFSLPRDVPLLVCPALFLLAPKSLVENLLVPTFLRSTTGGSVTVYAVHLDLSPASSSSSFFSFVKAARDFLETMISASLTNALVHHVLAYTRPGTRRASRRAAAAALLALVQLLLFHATTNTLATDSARESLLSIARGALIDAAYPAAQYWLASRWCGVDGVALVVPFFFAARASVSHLGVWRSVGAGGGGATAALGAKLLSASAGAWAAALCEAWAIERFLLVGVPEVETTGDGKDAKEKAE